MLTQQTGHAYMYVHKHAERPTYTYKQNHGTRVEDLCATSNKRFQLKTLL